MTVPNTSGSNQAHQSQALRMAVEEIGSINVTAVAGAATANAGAVVVTTESLSTAAGGQYTLTLTNSVINASGSNGDIVTADIWNGTNTTGTPSVTSTTPGTGSVVVVVQNVHASAAFNGTLKIGITVTRTFAQAPAV
jgi:hypothetical protein